MKLSSSTFCGCCFCCYCHCWLMMLLMVSSVVQVSPEMSASSTNKKYTKFYNRHNAYQSERTELMQLNKNIPISKTTTSILSTLPKPTPPLTQPQPKASVATTRTDHYHYKQNNVNIYPKFEHEATTTAATKPTKSTLTASVVASQVQVMTSIVATKQLQMTNRQPNLYDATNAVAPTAKRKATAKIQHGKHEGAFYNFVSSIQKTATTTSRTSATNNYDTDKSNVFLPSTMLRIGTTIKPFVEAVTMAKTKRQTNDYSTSNDNDRNNVKNVKYWNITIDLNPKLRQQQNQLHNNSSSSSGKTKNSHDFRNISNKGNNGSKQKTANTFSFNHNNRYGTINSNSNNNNKWKSKSISTTTSKASKSNQPKYLLTKTANETENALDAAPKATTINSLPSNGTTDFTRNSSHNFKNHNSISYNYIGTSTDSVSNLSPKEINQNSDASYHKQKRTSISGITSSTSLLLRPPATYTTLYRHQHNNQLKRPALLHRHGRQASAEDEQNEKCRMFVEGDLEKNELYSPEYPNEYPKNINCTRVITAPKGQIIRLDFRNSFNIEEKEECKFDFLEIRDGQYGFSNLIGKYCGTDFPPEITSRERYLWLHFHSDESIEYSGFTAVYEFIDRNRDAPSTDLNCTIEKDGFEGFINATDVPAEIKDTVIRNKIPLDCMWRIQVQEKWKIQVKFVDFKLAKPNDCETNFLDIFPEQTVMPLRVKNFCGSAGEGITSESNILHMRFYAEQIAINSTFSILYTAFRERGSSSCAEDEYDCEDATCIAGGLKCNGRSNCKFLWDEEGCEEEDEGQSEHMIIIITVFGLILGGMVITFLVNCIRKIMHDQKIIREHIRQSKESKLDEMGRNSKARSRENISVVSPRQKHSQTSLQILDDVSNRYYREMELQAKSNFKEKDPSIMRHDMIVQTSLCSTDDSSTTTTDQKQQPTPPAGVSIKACDMGCQTRESLFATASLLRQKSKTPSLSSSQRTIEGVPPPPRFSTFGYDAAQIAPPPPPTVSALSRRNMHLPQESLEMEQQPQQTTHTMAMMPQQQPHQQQQQQHQHLHHRPSQEICHHHHQHQQHLQQQQQKQTLPRHHAQQQHQPQYHQHSQHHHITTATIPTNVTHLPTSGTAVVTAISTGTSGRHREQGGGNAAVVPQTGLPVFGNDRSNTRF